MISCLCPRIPPDALESLGVSIPEPAHFGPADEVELQKVKLHGTATAYDRTHAELLEELEARRYSSFKRNLNLAFERFDYAWHPDKVSASRECQDHTQAVYRGFESCSQLIKDEAMVGLLLRRRPAASGLSKENGGRLLCADLADKKERVLMNEVIAAIRKAVPAK